MLEGKVAVITGGGRGIGKATALELAGRGCNVVVIARSIEEIENTAAAVKEIGCKSLAIQADITKGKDIERILSKIKKIDPIDFLINNAGIAFKKPMMETSEEMWDRTMNTNLKSVFLLTKTIIPMLAEDGKIVNISSLAGKEGIAGLSAYCASKFAVIGLSESLDKEIKQDVHVVCPGSVDTRMYNSLYPGAQPSLQPHQVARKIADICDGIEKNKVVEIGE